MFRLTISALLVELDLLDTRLYYLFYLITMPFDILILKVFLAITTITEIFSNITLINKLLNSCLVA